MAATPPPPGGYPPPGDQPPGPPSDAPFPPPGGAPPPPSGGWGPAPGPQAPPGPPPGPWQTPPPGGYGYGGYGQPGAGGYAQPKAGWWSRFAALLIDAIIIGLFSVPAIIALQAGPTEIETCSVDESGDIQFDQPDNAICEVPTAGTWVMFGLLEVAAFVGAVAYFGIMEGKGTQTLGKKALGIRVVDVTTGQPLGLGRGIGRYFGRILSALPCYLGYLWPLWDQQKQAFHDKVVNSVVVKA